MKQMLVLLVSVSILLQISLAIEFGDKIQQSKEHHEKYHELIKENYRYKEWYQNHSNNTDCDTFRNPTSVSINCLKYEL